MNTTTDTITVPLSLNSNLTNYYFGRLNRIPKDKKFQVSYSYKKPEYEKTFFKFMGYNSFEEFTELTKDELPENRKWMEILKDGCFVKECYDLDANPNPDKPQLKMFQLYKEKGADYMIEEFLKLRSKFIEEHYPKYYSHVYDKFHSCSLEENAIKVACTDKKFSVHIAINNQVYFEMPQLKMFAEKFSEFLKTTDFMIDTSIYSKNRSIRMLGNTKHGQNRHLQKHSSCSKLDDSRFLFQYTLVADDLEHHKFPYDIPEKEKKEKKVYIQNCEKPNINFTENENIDYKEMTQLLNLINSKENPNWSIIKQCIYDKTGGSDEGLEIFTKWSRDGGNIFTDDEYYKQWISAKFRNYETIPTLKKYAKEQSPEQYDELYPRVSFLRKNEFCPDDVGATYPNSHLDCGLFMIDKIKESGEIYYYNKKKTIFIYNDKLKIFEEQPIDKIMNFIPTFLLPVLQSVGDKLYQQSPKSTKEEKKSHQEKIKQVSKMIENIKSTPYQKCILTQIINRIEHSDDFIEKYFNRVPNLFPIANNKVIDFQTLEVMERTKDHYFTYTTDNVYFPDRPKKDDVYKYVSEILKTDNKDFITSFLTWNGYCLTGENCVKSIVFWTGDGDNGKSVAFNIFKKITGKSGVVGNDKVFTVSPRQSDSCHTDEYLPLIGKRSTYISEVKKGCKFNERLMKHISGNDGNLSLRGCGGTTLEVNIDCKMIGIVNSSDMPSFETEGFDNRIKIFPFANKFEKNPKKVKEIENMKDDIFTEFCYYVKNHFYDNDMNINFSQEIEKATNKYKISNDTVKMFFDSTIEITDNGKDRIPKTDIWTRYNDFCFEGEYQHIKLGKVEFYAYIETKLKIDIHRERAYKCVKYKVIENELDDDDE